MEDKIFDRCVPVPNQPPPTNGCDRISIPAVQYPDLIGTLTIKRGTNIVFVQPQKTPSVSDGSKDDAMLGYKRQRGENLNTLNFLIPAEVVHGQLHINVTVTLPNGDSEENDVYCDASLIRTLRVYGILITYDLRGLNFPGIKPQPDFLPAPTIADLHETSRLTLSMYPVQSTAEYPVVGAFTWTGLLRNEYDWTNLLTDMCAAVVCDGNTDCGLYYGLLPEGTPEGIRVGALPLGAKVGGLAISVGGAMAVGPSFNELTMAHELGHLCGLWHVCEPGQCDGPDPQYPKYPPYQLGSIGEFGAEIEGADITIHQPDYSLDLMSYSLSDRRWISPYHYMKLLGSVKLQDDCLSRPPPGEGPKTPSPGEPVEGATISIIGVVYAEKEIEVKSVARLNASTQIAGGEKTAMTAELVDEQGKILSRARVFSLRGIANVNGRCECRGQTAFPHVFQAFIPNVARGAALRIRRGENEIWTLRAPATPTRITKWSAQFISSGRKKSGQDRVALEWQVESAGQQEVESWVQWSKDGGKTWRGYVTGIRERTVEIDAAHLSSGQVSLRLLANDGFDTAMSDPVSIDIPRRDATITIFTPTEGQTLPTGVALRLWAAATGDDGITPPPEAVQWTLDGNKIGRSLDVITTAPSPGRHQATVIVSVHGRDTKRTVNFETVGEPNPPPIPKAIPKRQRK